MSFLIIGNDYWEPEDTHFLLCFGKKHFKVVKEMKLYYYLSVERTGTNK